MMDKDRELAIAAGLRAGDRSAWTRLYDAYAERLWTGVGRLMGFEPAAADVVQETFLAAARSAGGYRPGRGSLWAWLWGIARRQIALHYRKQASKGESPVSQVATEGLDWIDAGAEVPEDVLAGRETAALVRRVLRELPGEYQMLLLAKHVDGQPVEQIARDLGCSRSAAASKLARARKAFRKAFGRLTRTARSAGESTEVSP